MRTIMLKLRIMSYSMAMKIKIFTFNSISGPSLSLPCLESDRDGTRWHHDDIRIVRSWKHKSSYHNVHHAHISLTTEGLLRMPWPWIWCSEGHLSQMMVSGLLTMSKWSCQDCCLGPDIVYEVWHLLTPITQQHPSPPPPPPVYISGGKTHN